MNLSLGGGQSTERYTSAAASTPAAISGFINLGIGLENTWAYGNTPDQIGLDVNIEPVLRSQDKQLVVLEFQQFVCPLGAYCLNDQTGGLKRSDTRAVYDRPADLVLASRPAMSSH
jgi:hypothetical protein